jgi:hypothetical protein
VRLYGADDYLMDLVCKRSGGKNVVGRPQGRPAWYPTATAPVAQVEVYWKYDDEAPAAARLIDVFGQGQLGSLHYNPTTDKNIQLATISISPSGTRSVRDLADAVWVTVLFARTATAVAGLDAHVPTVTIAPSVATAPGTLDQWLVFTPAPDANGATLTNGEIRVEKADDATVYEVWGIPVVAQWQIPKKAYACNIKYRWRNQSSEDSGNGRGWSSWSPNQSGAQSGSATPDPPASTVMPTFVFDPHDSLNGLSRGVITS